MSYPSLINYYEQGGPTTSQKCVAGNKCIEADLVSKCGHHCIVSVKYETLQCMGCERFTHKHKDYQVCMALHIVFQTGTHYKEQHIQKEGGNEQQRLQWALEVLSTRGTLYGTN